MRAYLAGAINGCTDAEAHGWREELKARMPRIRWVDPMARDYRMREDWDAETIVAGDLADIEQCEVVVVYALRPSWGTAMEVVYAHQMKKRVVVWCPGVVSPWLRYHATVVVTSVYELESELVGAYK